MNNQSIITLSVIAIVIVMGNEVNSAHFNRNEHVDSITADEETAVTLPLSFKLPNCRFGTVAGQ